MSQSRWLVGGMLPGIERQPRKKLEPSPLRKRVGLHHLCLRPSHMRTYAPRLNAVGESVRIGRLRKSREVEMR
jgi:hypothetical protein